jgi:hypothetical protein
MESVIYHVSTHPDAHCFLHTSQSAPQLALPVKLAHRQRTVSKRAELVVMLFESLLQHLEVRCEVRKLQVPRASPAGPKPFVDCLVEWNPPSGTTLRCATFSIGWNVDVDDEASSTQAQPGSNRKASCTTGQPASQCDSTHRQAVGPSIRRHSWMCAACCKRGVSAPVHPLSSKGLASGDAVCVCAGVVTNMQAACSHTRVAP